MENKRKNDKSGSLQSMMRLFHPSMTLSNDVRCFWKPFKIGMIQSVNLLNLHLLKIS